VDNRIKNMAGAAAQAAQVEECSHSYAQLEVVASGGGRGVAQRATMKCNGCKQQWTELGLVPPLVAAMQRHAMDQASKAMALESRISGLEAQVKKLTK